MPTILKCVQCGAEILRKDVFLGNAKDLESDQCVCSKCLPTYDVAAKSPSKKQTHIYLLVIAVTLLVISTIVAILCFPIFSSSIRQERTAWKKPEIRKAFVDAVTTLPDEMRKSGINATPVPIRFPTGNRGARIERYAKMAVDGKIKEIAACLETGADNPAILREILAGIARSERPEFVETVRPFLAHSVPEVRAIGVLAFGKIAGPKDLPALQPLQTDKHPHVRAAAKMAIAALKSATKK